MFQPELDEIQSQLKAAIQNHQILVAKIQLQPQDMTLKTQLHELQKDIMSMSQRQKTVVQKLKKNLIQRQSIENYQLESDDTDWLSACEKSDSERTKPAGVTHSHRTHDKEVDEKQQSTPLRIPKYQHTKSPVSQGKKGSSHSDRTLSKSPTTSSGTSCERARELKKKIDFMACIDLVPPDSVRDSQGRRAERKRKSTNNPNFAYGFELERRPKLSNFLASDYFGAKKTKSAKAVQPSSTSAPQPVSPGSPNTKPSPDHPISIKENTPQTDTCTICGQTGQFVKCGSCGQIYHPQCLSPPLPSLPTGQWNCSKCQESNDRVNSLTLSAVSAYISNKTGKEEDRRRLLKRSAELLQEKLHLENRTKQLNEILARQGIKKQELLEINLKAKQSVENLKNFVKAVQSS